MNNLKMYYIEDDYINYLRKFDNKVPFNKNQSRPYIGIVIDRNNVHYFAPLSSPKPKHLKMNNSIDIYKIKNGELGVINLNNMIPVSLNNIIKIDIDNQAISYKNLLNNQMQNINNNKKELFKKVDKLYTLFSKNAIPYIASRCCNFVLLEEKCSEYIAMQEAAATKIPFNDLLSTKEKIVTIYKKEFPPIKHITEESATLIDDLNIKNGYTMTIKEIKDAYIQSGKNLELSNSVINKKQFDGLEEINLIIKDCQSKENQINVHDKVNNKKLTIPDPEI